MDLPNKFTFESSAPSGKVISTRNTAKRLDAMQFLLTFNRVDGTSWWDVCPVTTIERRLSLGFWKITSDTIGAKWMM